MATTSMQLDSGLRDELAEVAEHDFRGVSLGEAVRRLLKEHKINQIVRRYEELRADPDEWATYQAESRMADRVGAELVPDAPEEYPEYNQ